MWRALLVMDVINVVRPGEFWGEQKAKVMKTSD